MSETTLGYIVTLEGRPMWEERRKFVDFSARGVLYFGGTVTVFPSRKAAQRAIDRTKAYAIEHGHNWGKDYRIARLEAQQVAQ